jgi:hypothetical protein
MLAEMLLRISERLLAGGAERVAAAGADPAAQLRALVAFQVDFALDNPALITVQDRDLGALSEPDARQVRQLQRRYVEVWVAVIARLHPEATTAACRARAHAVFGLINSTPHSAGRLARPAMAALLADMAVAAATAHKVTCWSGALPGARPEPAKGEEEGGPSSAADGGQ